MEIISHAVLLALHTQLDAIAGWPALGCAFVGKAVKAAEATPGRRGTVSQMTSLLIRNALFTGLFDAGLNESQVCMHDPFSHRPPGSHELLPLQLEVKQSRHRSGVVFARSGGRRGFGFREGQRGGLGGGDGGVPRERLGRPWGTQRRSPSLHHSLIFIIIIIPFFPLLYFFLPSRGVLDDVRRWGLHEGVSPSPW
jgi:hypothetical protein